MQHGWEYCGGGGTGVDAWVGCGAGLGVDEWEEAEAAGFEELVVVAGFLWVCGAPAELRAELLITKEERTHGLAAVLEPVE